MKKKKVMAKSVLALLMCAAMLASTVLVGGVGVITASAAEATTPETVAEASAAVMDDTADLMENTGTSRMEMTEKDTLGLAFKFVLKATDWTCNEEANRYAEGRYDIDYSQANVQALGDGTPYRLVTAGAVLTNDPSVGQDADSFTLDNVDTVKKTVINVPAVKAWEPSSVNADLSYMVRIINIPSTHVDTDIYARAYYVFSNNGVVTTVYDDIFSASYNTTKFATKFTNPNFMYRVGNKNAVSVGSLFKAANDTTNIGENVSVNIETVDGTAASGTYTANASDWTQGTVKFEDTGVVKLTISDGSEAPYIPAELYLEVVDATNATSATSATDKNIVLLNDAGFSALTVSNGYALYGNGFTLTCGSDSPALDFGYSFVTLDNGTLDNVQIVCPNMDYAALYKSQLESSENRSQTTDRTRYYNAKSAIIATGNSQILNSRVSGGRAALNATGGNILVDNSRLELGALATVLIGATNSFTFRDTVLVQKPTPSTYDPNKTLIGFSVLAVCDANNIPTINIEGDFVQDAWANESYSQYVPSAGKSVVQTVLNKNDFKHDLDGDGIKESVNLGFAFMSADEYGSVSYDDVTIKNTDNRTNREAIPYETTSISSAAVYSYLSRYNNKEYITDSSYINVPAYEPNRYSDIVTVGYSDAADGLVVGKSFGTDGWVHELNVDLDKLSDYQLDFNKVAMKVNGVAVSDFTVNGGAKPAPVAVTVGGTTYTLTATVNGKEHTALFKVTGTETSKESPSKISGPTTAGFGVAKSYGGDWSGAADVLTGVKIKYWSVAEKKYVEFDFTNFTVPGTAGKLNGTNTYWEYVHTNDDFSLKVTNTAAIHSNNNVYGMPIRGEDGKLYFTISSTSGYVGTGTTSRSITMQYEFTDNNGGETLTFTHTFKISYNKDDQYSYSDLSGSGKLTKLESSSGGFNPCVTPDTLITLADGSQKRIDQVTYNDQILAWDFYKGEYVSVPASIVMNHGYDVYDVVTLMFDDGTVVKTINGHGFFDVQENEFVILGKNNVEQYLDHYFVKDAEQKTATKLVSYSIHSEYTESWSVLTAVNYNCFLEGMLTLTPAEVEGSPKYLMPYEIGDDMKYDEVKMQEDIAKYGLYTYEDFAEYCTYEQFVGFGFENFKVSIGKGYITKEELEFLLKLHIG